MSDLAQLLPVSKAQFSDEEQLCVNMRNVHNALGVGRDYSTWIKDRIAKYGFEEHVDYEKFADQLNQNFTADALPNFGEPIGAGDIECMSSGEQWQGRIDYYFTLDAAKEVAMVENNEKGREIRKYFIACEKQLRKTTPSTYLEALEQCIALEKARLAECAEKEKAQAALQAEQSAHLDTQYDLSVTRHELIELNDRYSEFTAQGSVNDMRSAYDMQAVLLKYFDTGKRRGDKGFWWYMSGFMHTYCHGGIRNNSYSVPGLNCTLPGELTGHVYQIAKRDGTTVFDRRAWADVTAYFKSHKDSLKDLPYIGYAARS